MFEFENKKYFILSLPEDRRILLDELNQNLKLRHERFYEFELLDLKNFKKIIYRIGYTTSDTLSTDFSGSIWFGITNNNYMVFDTKRAYEYWHKDKENFKALRTFSAHLGINIKKHVKNFKELFSLTDSFNKGPYTGSNEWKYDFCKKYKIRLINELSYLVPPEGKYWENDELLDN